MSYALDGESEFERLERQSKTAAYDYKGELAELLPQIASGRTRRVLDAGCGSGIVSRYLARQLPGVSVYGCDFSTTRVEQASSFAGDIPNLQFVHGRLEALPFPDGHFDVIVCRFALQHLTAAARTRAVKQFFRCLKPGGILRVIDIDGGIVNIYPASASLKSALSRIFDSGRIDMNVGRKIPSLLQGIGFGRIGWEIQTLNFQGDLLNTERELNAERFDAGAEFFAGALGSKQAFNRFRRDYLNAMSQPGTVLFYNKFIISAQKPRNGTKPRFSRG